MFEFLFVAGYVLIPLGFGLVPGFLPATARPGIRWALWLALFALAGEYLSLIKDAPQTLRLLALLAVATSTMLSLLVLIAATKRAMIARHHRHHHPASGPA